MDEHAFGSADYVLDKIRCPLFGNEVYGEWSALNMEQRRALKILAMHDKCMTETCELLMRKLEEANNGQD